jgi:hypothetical protein
VTALDPLEIAKLADKKELQGTAPAWARPWLYLVCGDARWEKLLKTDSAEAKELKEDGTVWYRDRLQAGVAAQLVEKLAKLPLPATRAEAEPVVQTIRELTTAHAKAPVVLLKKDALTNCARGALLVLAAESTGAEFVSGKLTTTDAGSATLLYEFDDRAEANDFKLAKGHLADWRRTFAAGSNTEEQSTLEWKAGAIVLRGNAMWRLPIGFIAPLSMRIEYDRQVEEGKLQRMASLAFHVCDDGKSSYVHTASHGQIIVRDDETGATSQAGPNTGSYFPGRTYVLEIVHDGRQVTSKMDGVEAAKTEAGKLVGGGIEIMAICDGPATLHKIEITGKIDPASLVAARGAWVALQLRELGL